MPATGKYWRERRWTPVLCWLLLLVLFSPCEGEECITLTREKGNCIPLIHCPEVYDDFSETEEMTCLLKDRTPGVCCSISGRSSQPEDIEPILMPLLNHEFGQTLNRSFPEEEVDDWMQLVSAEDLQEARLQGLRKLLRRERKEKELLDQGFELQKGTAEYLHMSFLRPFPEALAQSRAAIIQDETNKILLSRIQTKRQFNPNSGPRCPRRPCNEAQINARYRLLDGSCNNPFNANWGQSFTALNRLLRPAYSDGFSRPRIASDRRNLPSPRVVSLNLITDSNSPSNRAALILMNWGQFLSHDITLTALSTMNTGAGITCCSGMMATMPFLRHEECFPIDIPPNDPFYSTFRMKCMEFVRSLPAASNRKSCEFGFRDQLNEVTSFIDGSVIYGNSENVLKFLRTFQGGKLKSVNCFGSDYLPFVNASSTGCGRPFQSYMTGDIRATEQVHLSAIHTIFLREHNKIADRLAVINPHWDDESLFLETRRVIGAIMQHITYNEYLPIVLGKKLVAAFNLMPLRDGHTTDYNPNINPGMLNEFSAAANRYGHSLIQGILHMMNERDESEGTIRVREQFATPVPLYFPQNLDRILRGATKQPVQNMDRFVSKEVTQHLYQFNSPFGLDLAAANIQRGRDHGLPGYNAYRVFCGLKKAEKFEDFSREMDAESIRRLKLTYRSVDDVDVWVAAVSERSLEGAIVGPTIACLLLEQYWRLKIGDRYYYEFRDGPGAFTTHLSTMSVPRMARKDSKTLTMEEKMDMIRRMKAGERLPDISQLNEIRKISLSRMICDNSDKMKQMQPLAFLQPTDWNPRVSCDTSAIPRMDFEAWREFPTPLEDPTLNNILRRRSNQVKPINKSTKVDRLRLLLHLQRRNRKRPS